MTHNWFNIAFFSAVVVLLCLTWARRKTGCSGPRCLWWHSLCLTTAHFPPCWWQLWIMWQLSAQWQRPWSTTPTSQCRTSACCCSMKTLGSPGELGEMGPQPDPGPRERAFCVSQFGWEGTRACAFPSKGWRSGKNRDKTCFIYFLQSPLLGSSAPGSQCAFLYISSLEAALCQGQNPGHFQPNLHYILHTSEYHSVPLNWWVLFLLPLMSSITELVEIA